MGRRQVALDSDEFFHNIPAATDEQRRAAIRIITNSTLSESDKAAFLDALGLATVIRIADLMEEVAHDLRGLGRGA